MLAILFWVIYVLAFLGGAFWRWPGNPTLAYGIDLVVMLLIGALGVRVFPVTL